MSRAKKNLSVTGCQPSGEIEIKVIKMYQNPAQESTPKSVPHNKTKSSTGMDTIRIWIPGLHLIRDRAYGETGAWFAWQCRQGVDILMHSSHGAKGDRWRTAPLGVVKSLAKAVARELAEHVVGGCTPTWLMLQIISGSITRTDPDWDVKAKWADVSVTAPETQYGKMRDWYCPRTGATTHYWGTRARKYRNKETGEEVRIEPSAREMRVYDKRAQMLDSRKIDIGEEWTRIEIQLNGNRAVRQALGFGTLGEMFQLTEQEFQTRIKLLFAGLSVKVEGEGLSPLTSCQRKKIEKRPELARRLHRAERQAKKYVGYKGRSGKAEKSLAVTEKSECLVSLCFRSGSRRKVPFTLTPEWERVDPAWTLPQWACGHAPAQLTAKRRYDKSKALAQCVSAVSACKRNPAHTPEHASEHISESLEYASDQ